MTEKEKKDQVVLTKQEYDKLVEDSRFLDALISKGVDNWEGYEDAIDMIDPE